MKEEKGQRINKKKDLSALRNPEMRAAFRSFVWSDIEENMGITSIDGGNALLCEAMHSASDMLL